LQTRLGIFYTIKIKRIYWT